MDLRLDLSNGGTKVEDPINYDIGNFEFSGNIFVYSDSEDLQQLDLDEMEIE